MEFFEKKPQGLLQVTPFDYPEEAREIRTAGEAGSKSKWRLFRRKELVSQP